MTRGVDLKQGETITLRASAVTAATAGTNGTAVFVGGERVVYSWVLDVTAAATDAADTLDVYIDTLFGTATWVNIAHFAQCLGDGGARRLGVVTVPTNLTSTEDIEADLAAGSARGYVGSQFRARWVMVDADADGNFTWSCVGYAI